ncbi:MAG: hypothetical protein Q7V57_06390 [Actinomycetota bacterium]|nr:hypothetical protein [Actinomycetota bacterium]
MTTHRTYVRTADLPALVAEYGNHHFQPELNGLRLSLHAPGRRGLLLGRLTDPAPTTEGRAHSLKRSSRRAATRQHQSVGA